MPNHFLVIIKLILDLPKLLWVFYFVGFLFFYLCFPPWYFTKGTKGDLIWVWVWFWVLGRKIFNKSFTNCDVKIYWLNNIITDYLKDGSFIPIREWKTFDTFWNGFSAQKGLARLPFRVGHHVCLGPTVGANVAPVMLIWPWYIHLKFWNSFFDIK